MRIMIACRQGEASDSLQRILKGIKDARTDLSFSASEARRKLQYVSYDVVIVNTPLSDEFGLELALDFADSTDSAFVLLVKNDVADEIEYKLRDTAAFVVPKPVNPQVLCQNIRFVGKVSNKMEKLRVRNEQLLKKIEDLKVIDRAKCCLVANLSMSEEEAHRYIQKQSMDTRVTPKEVADGILKKYFN